MLRRPVESSQYASAQITAFAVKNGITRSMGLTGICWDNAMAESFFTTLKTEFYYHLTPPRLAHPRQRDPGSRRLDRGPLQPSTPALLDRTGQLRRLRTAILVKDRGSSTRHLTRVHSPGARPATGQKAFAWDIGPIQSAPLLDRPAPGCGHERPQNFGNRGPRVAPAVQLVP